ncbi:MAG TPA: amidase [Candidatus Udaeobacter sp.]|nr:amidase [Candidatus Udaeobacter sp.]
MPAPAPEPIPDPREHSLPDPDSWPRREVLKALAAAGFTAGTFGRALVALAGDSPKVTTDMIQKAAWVSGLDFTKDDRKMMVKDLEQTLEAYAKLRAVPLDNGVPPALVFEPFPVYDTSGFQKMKPYLPWDKEQGTPAPSRPASDEDLAFASATTLSKLLDAGQVTSVELTRIYLDRLKRADPTLHCVIHLTEELALEQAAAADQRRIAGKAGLLSGVPWGAKDLIAVNGAPTTWGAGPYRDQVRPEQATVADHLSNAGAVLLAKLSVGELAWGDVWYGGTTKNPWKTDQGSSGSSAGSGAATAAGLCGFALGTETWGSIVSPSTRCGVSGLRPTFGRVSRYGVMGLAWSMDKVGVLARSVDDLELVFSVIEGQDGRDIAVRPGRIDRFSGDPRALKIGYPVELFDFDYTEWAEEESEKPGLKEWQALDQETLKTLRELGFNLVPITLPKDLPIGALQIILTAEAAAAFDDLVRSGRVKELARQTADAWPNVFRQGQLIPAVEYVRANRIRTLLMKAMAESMKDVNLFVAPTFGGDVCLASNLTGHPAVVVPNGFRASDGTPTSITFTGHLDEEEKILAIAKVYQEATGFHLKRPPLQF